MSQENVHSIRNFQLISNKNINSVRYILEAICHRTPFRWENRPTDIKVATSLSDFRIFIIAVHIVVIHIYYLFHFFS